MPGRVASIWLVAGLTWIAGTSTLSAQTISQRGFIEGSVVFFPQQAPNDPTRIVGDLLARDDVFVKPAPWLDLAAGLDVRANSHDQVDDSWRLDFSDRGVRRPRLSVHRLSATVHRGPWTIDLGKQFIRWGQTDIVTPTDRFAPRDFLNVVDNDFLAVTGARATIQLGTNAVEGVWVPRFTPSRVPLLDQRWTAVPSVAANIPLVDAGAALPKGSQVGVRWSHVGEGFEYALSYFDGFNHLPNVTSSVRPEPPEIDVAREYPAIRMYGADAAVPTRWFTVKGETAYFTSPSTSTDEYVLYVVQLERQTGEWLIVGGYAGEVVTARRAALTFAPDRGMTRSLVGRASYTIDSTRSVAVETAVRQNGRGMYGKVEYSQAYGDHWRATATAVLVRGDPDDFLGQYRLNSHLGLALRYSF